MPRHRYEPPRGRIEQVELHSEHLAANVVGDPSRRLVAVYLPPGHDGDAADYPLVVDLAGYTGSGLKRLGWQAFGESVPQRLDRLVEEGRMGPVIAAFPDGFTALGGNQYVDSAALGRWERFLVEVMLPELERRFRVRPGPDHRAVLGKSSGGYGALVQALRHGEHWNAAACHSGDMGFDLIYRRDLPIMLDRLASYDGDVGAFIEAIAEAPKVRGGDFHALMLLAMAASYDPDPKAPWGVRLPVDPLTCELIPERWERWLAHDPLTLIELHDCQASLRRLARLWIDCGSHDQYFLHYPARALHRRLEALGIEHHYEEFDDDHSGLDYRLDRSLPWLYEAIA